MKNVTIYSTDYCPFCVRAKRICDDHEVAYEEINLSGDDEGRRKLVERTGMMTVPQIFIGEEFVGGCQDLEALVHQGRFPAMVNED